MRTKQAYIGTVTNNQGTKIVAISAIKWIVIHELKKTAKENGSNFGKDFWKDICDWENRTTLIDKSRAYRYDITKYLLYKREKVSTMKEPTPVNDYKSLMRVVHLIDTIGWIMGTGLFLVSLLVFKLPIINSMLTSLGGFILPILTRVSGVYKVGKERRITYGSKRV